MDPISIKTWQILDKKIGEVVLPLPILPPEYASDLQSMLRLADEHKKLKTDVDEITMDVCNGEADLVVMALDARDSDSFAHLPILSLTRKVVYFFTEHIPAASGESRSVCCVTKGSPALDTSIRVLCGAMVLEETAGNYYFESMLQLLVRFGPISIAFYVASLIRMAMENDILKMGIDEVNEALCKGSADLVVIAANAQDLDRMLHLPILAESKDAFCIFVPSTQFLSFDCDFPPEYEPVNVCCITHTENRAIAGMQGEIKSFFDRQLQLSEKAPLKTYSFRTSRSGDHE